ncbi:hypothetical protein GCM10027296_14300 [Chitinimonas naiadis]
MSVADVSNKLKLSKRQVEALEADEYSALPGNTFVRGFVRNYARLLELDAQPLIQFLDSHLPKEAAQAALPRLRDEALPVLRPGGNAARVLSVPALVVGLLVALGGAGSYWWFYVQRGAFEPELMLKDGASAQPVAPTTVVAPEAPATSTTPEAALTTTPEQAAAAGVPLADTASASASTTDVAPAMPTVAPAPAVVAPPVVATATAPASAPVPPAVTTPAPVAVVAPAALPVTSGDLRLVAKKDSWVQITDSTGRRLINQVLSAGETRSVGGTPPYKIRIGNGHQTELYYKGKPTDLTPYIKVDVANLELN